VGIEMSALVAAIAAGVSVGLLASGTGARRRLHTIQRARGSGPVSSGPVSSGPVSTGARSTGARSAGVGPVVPARSAVWRLQRLTGVLLALCLVGLLGVPWGLGAGVLAVVLVPRWLRRLEPTADRRRRARIAADLPLAVDLLAACLRAGRPVGDGLTVVAGAVGGPLGALLAEVDARLRLGADPADAWGVLAGQPGCAPLARAVERAVRSGAPLADSLEQLAGDVRQERRWSADERARAVEARSVVPLGLCFLPAFVLIGIVPTVAGALSGVMSVFGGSG
jgi:Flp pilus assembly protein TadB